MGACCGKGSSTKDPDKAPYTPSQPKDESGKDAAEIPQDKEKAGENAEAAKPKTEVAEGDKKEVEVAENETNKDADTKTGEAHVISVDIASEEHAKVNVESENEAAKPEALPSVPEEKQDESTKAEPGEATEPAGEKKEVKPSDISITFRDSFETPPFRSFRDNWPEIKKVEEAPTDSESPAYSARFRPLITTPAAPPDPKSIIDSIKAKQDNIEPVAVSVHVPSTTVATGSETQPKPPATVDQQEEIPDSNDVVITKTTVTTETIESPVESETGTELKSPFKTVTFAVEQPGTQDDASLPEESSHNAAADEAGVKEEVVKVEAAIEETVETKASVEVDDEVDATFDEELKIEEEPALEVREDNEEIKHERKKKKVPTATLR